MNLADRFIIMTTMGRKKRPSETTEAKISDVMSLLAQRSVEARRKKWGKKEFIKRMREYGKLGGRPPKSKPKGGKKQ